VKVRSALLCELCRPDLGNKWTLLGVFAGDLFLPSFPAQLQLSAYLEMDSVSPGNHTMSIKVDAPGVEMRVEGNFEATGEATVVSMPLPNLQLGIDEPGDLVINVSLDGGEQHEVARRRISLEQQ
jgi:hypothetical protein